MFRSVTYDVRRTIQRGFATAAPSPTHSLNRLPKSPHTIKALKYRRSVPGSAANVIYSGNIPKVNYLDPSHPALAGSSRLKLNVLPSYTCAAFSLRTIPFSLLDKPEMERIIPRHDNFGVLYKKGNTKQPLARMAIVTLFSKAIARSNYIRNRIRQRLKTALGLAVARQAVVDEQGLHVDEGSVMPDEFLLKDWCYVFTPAAELYRMPMEDIIAHGRSALLHVRRLGLAKEGEWANPKPLNRTGTQYKPNGYQGGNRQPQRDRRNFR